MATYCINCKNVIKDGETGAFWKCRVELTEPNPVTGKQEYQLCALLNPRANCYDYQELENEAGQ
jgi:hypothetical protein